MNLLTDSIFITTTKLLIVKKSFIKLIIRPMVETYQLIIA
jgi:hypothetical protein